MLLNVHIKNFALIDDVNVSFTDKLNILTGETGAGKSIIMGALKLGMGAKIQKDMLRNPDLEGLVQLLFLVEDEDVLNEIKNLGVNPSEEGEIIISRRITNGRTINTINDEAVTGAKLKEVSSLLVDMHAQHEQQILLKRAEHLKILDKFGKKEIQKQKAAVANAYETYMKVFKELNNVSMNETEKNQKLEFLKYQINEIEAANLKDGEDLDVEKQYKKMINSRDIIEAASKVYESTGYGNAASAGNVIGQSVVNLKSVKDMDQGLDDLYLQLENIDALINDFNLSISCYLQDMEFEPSQFDQVEQRLNLINDMKAKYGKSIMDVLDFSKEAEKEYDKLAQYDLYVQNLKEELKNEENKYMKEAQLLTKIRKQEAKKLSLAIKDSLKDLSFLDVQFDMVFEKLDKISNNGLDDVYFIISTNVGEKPRPLYEVASGGELSRIMLAVKSCMAGEDNIDTLIFDEIDVGISGMAAQKVSEKLASIAKNHQVISITHLPQIAAMADNHYKIEKKVINGKTITDIYPLNEEDSVNEIARLLGGARITDAVILNAREMKKLAGKTKNY